MVKGRWVLWIGLQLSLLSPIYAKINNPQADSHDSEKLKAALVQVQHKIQTLEKTIYQSKSQERDCIKQLAELEKEIGEREETLRQLEIKMNQHDNDLALLEQTHRQYAQQNQIQQAALARLVQASYQHHHKERLRLLLEPNESSSLARLNHYYQFFVQARSKKLNELQVDLKKVQSIQLQILQEQQYARELQQKLSSEKLAFAENKESRKRLLNMLSSRLEGDTQQLESLQHQQAHLDKLFSALGEQLAITPTEVAPLKHFAKMKRQLSLPITLPQATLAALPQAQTTKTTQKKSYIWAQEGTPVHAIFPGKVVFAEWLRGVGLLMIVDHGQGYMSLYGNNQKLYKTIGDTVEEGEMIARVGQSGGHAQPGLYFEIRKNGEALDPTPWFKNG